MFPKDHLHVVKAELSSPTRPVMFEHHGIAAVNLWCKWQLYGQWSSLLKLMSGTCKGKLWITGPRSLQQRRHMSRCSHLVCVKLKAKKISRVDYESLSPAYYVGPPHTVHTHSQSQYLVNCHTFMRPMNITGVTNYNLSVVQASLDVFLFMVLWLLYALLKALLYQSSSNCISEDIYTQLNDYYC